MVETKARKRTTNSSSSSSFGKKSTGGFNVRPKTKTFHKGSTFELRNGKGSNSNFNSKSEIDLIDDSKGKGFENKGGFEKRRGFENKGGFERNTNFKNQFNAAHHKPVKFRSKFNSKPDIDLIDDSGGSRKNFENKGGFERQTNFKNHSNVNHKRFGTAVKSERNKFQENHRTLRKDNSFEFRRSDDGVNVKGYKRKNNTEADLEVDGGGGEKGMVNKGFERKNSSKKQFDDNQNTPVRFGRNKFQEKNKASVDDDLDDIPKKKKKRGIRLDRSGLL